MNEVHYSSQSNEWGTPKELFDKYNKIYGFKLDAAATKENALCKNFFTIEDDALTKEWYSYERVWLNPPYGRVVGKFIEKAYKESLKGCIVVCLIPARTDTTYFHDYCFKYGKVEFIRGRVKFVNLSDQNKKTFSAPFPSCIVIFNGI